MCCQALLNPKTILWDVKQQSPGQEVPRTSAHCTMNWPIPLMWEIVFKSTPRAPKTKLWCTQSHLKKECLY